ncbi:MAG: polysaccharide biosynthesis protein [Synergistaceae bacterium]|jgi:FlaA1/EpsC-like NDP-sugar epimerase|nr:polysaccharide biosynthesis protein [Synergistaceae bacterium]
MGTSPGRKFAEFWLSLARRNRRVLVLDIFLLAFAVYAGFALRLSILVDRSFWGNLFIAAAAFPLCAAMAFFLSGVYRVYWPQASVEEYARLARAYACGSAAFLCAGFFVRSIVIPRTSLAIMLFAGLFFTGGVRASWRLAELSMAPGRTGGQGGDRGRAPMKKTLIIGAGEAGAYIARDMQRRAYDLMPVGFIDGDPEKMGKRIAGIPVLGDDDDLAGIVASMGIEVVLIAIPSASGARVREYLSSIAPLGVEVRVLPALWELADGRVEVTRLRSVELQDLLRREPIKLDDAGIGGYLAGKRVLVTGAGGSIGREICVQALRHNPSELFVLGHGEQSIYALTQQFREDGVTAPYRPVIADIADFVTMRRFFEAHKPDVVFHAAAHKHVPLMEENPREAFRVNALGTWALSELAGSYGTERFVMISSDKAVRPSSVMGATKRVAERLLVGAWRNHPDTRYMTVRFGNVLGSRGSVVPLFERQIRAGGPVTVTHRDMTRYFMLIPEAVSLVLQAGVMGRGGELYVLDMGEPVNITEMAETLIRLHGREPYRDIQIVFTGVRQGEKLTEELFYDEGNVARTGHDKIFLSRIDENIPLFHDAIQSTLDENLDEESIRREIFTLGK